MPRRRSFRLVALAAVLLAAAAARVFAADEAPAVRISADASGATTRVMLTSARSLSANVTAAKGRIEVVYSEPVTFSPAERHSDDGVLEGWEVRGDRTLVLKVGSGYRDFETFNLKNPSRLVVDIEGDSETKTARSRRAKTEAEPSFVVVIDPGHGGVEVGAIGPTGLQEKDVALDLARRLKSVLQQDPGVNVVLTRDADQIVPLDERTAIANHNRADLFLSFHLNSARGRKALGAETFYLSSNAADDAARTDAAIENRAYDLPGAKVEGRALDPDLQLVLWDLAQNQYLEQSSRLAESIQTELNELAGTRNRGVRQAPFTVLMGATMPAVLIEAGFISNPDEEARFKTDEHRDKVVQAVARAIRDFRSRYAATSGTGAANSSPGGGGR